MTAPATPQAHTRESQLDRTSRLGVRWAAFASVFLAFAAWGFWDEGPFVLGINAAAYFAALMGLFLWTMRHRGADLRRQRYWIVPLGMIVASYALYENPVLKMVSLPVLALMGAIFANAGMLSSGSGTFWDEALQSKIVVRMLSAVGRVAESIRAHAQALTPQGGKAGVARRVSFGIALFAVLAFAVVIPLLGAADGEFAASMASVVAAVRRFVSTSAAGKAVFAAALSVASVAMLLAWTRPFTHTDAPQDAKRVDSIVAGIVIGGTLALYLLFLGIQAKHLIIGRLPVTFDEVEQVVKSGFWQLLALTVLNIGIFLAAYRKTAPLVQRLLGAFSGASLLLLASAGYRMALYVTSYGFSYEKFFASYAVLYCAILLVWLATRLSVPRRADIAKAGTLLFLWMFALLTIFPVEQFVMRANVALARREGTQIRLYELTMLSSDVLGLVKRYEREGMLEEQAVRYARETSASGANADWGPWIQQQEDRLREKRWYEMNLSNFLNGR